MFYHANRLARAFGELVRQYLAQNPKDHRGLRLQVLEAMRRGPQLRDFPVGVGRLSAAATGRNVLAQTAVKQGLERVCF